MARAPSNSSLSALVREAGVVTEAALVDVVAGAPVHGSWWGHPKGKAIFRALEALHEDADVFLCKLREGQQTYVHRRLWPALLRVQAERALWPSLSVAARRLLARVERDGAVTASGPLRLELERTLRVAARSEHTPSGAHRVVLTPFASHFSAEHRREARRLSLEEAQAALSMDGGPKAGALRGNSGRRGRGKAPPKGRR